MKCIATSSSRYDALQERYSNFMSQPRIRHFVGAGGIVSIAAEAREFDQVNALAQAGHRCFAEKYLQESIEKYVHPNDLNLHYFGILQTNKIHRILQGFDHVEGIASLRQANFIQRILQEDTTTLKTRNFFVQVNLGRESNKNGVAPEAAPELIEYCLLLNLPVTGLMTIPPKAEPPAIHFNTLRKLADDYGLPHCQMGFSNDYTIAIDCGATHIRIGTAIWGEKYPPNHGKSKVASEEDQIVITA